MLIPYNRNENERCNGRTAMLKYSYTCICPGKTGDHGQRTILKKTQYMYTAFKTWCQRTPYTSPDRSV